MKKEKLVKRIKQSISNSGMTQKEFCEKSGINYDLFTQYLPSKTRRIPYEWIIAVSELTGVTTDFLFGLENNTNKNHKTSRVQGQDNGN